MKAVTMEYAFIGKRSKDAQADVGPGGTLEQRKHLRGSVHLLLENPLLEKPAAVDPVLARLKPCILDLSTGGVFLAGPPLTLGSEIDLTFRLSDLNHTVRARGRIVRSAVSRSREDVKQALLAGVGVSFTDLSAEDRRAISQFISASPSEAAKTSPLSASSHEIEAALAPLGSSNQ